MVGGWSNHVPVSLTLRKSPSAHRTGGWVGSKGHREEWGKFEPTPLFEPRTFQFVASRYTECVLTAAQKVMYVGH